MNLVLATSLIGLSVASLEDKSKIGYIRKILIDTDAGKVMGFVIAKNIIAKSQLILLSEVFGLDKSALVIKDQTVITDIEEVVAAKAILGKGVGLIGHRVISQEGRKIGRVVDLGISLDNGLILKFYVRSFLMDRIIPRSRIIEITKKGVVVHDDPALHTPVPQARPI